MPDLQVIMSVIQNLGAMGILGIIVYKSPQILARLTEHTQGMIKQVRETQGEALTVYKGEQDKLLNLIDEKLSMMITEMKSISDRVQENNHAGAS